MSGMLWRLRRIVASGFEEPRPRSIYGAKVWASKIVSMSPTEFKGYHTSKKSTPVVGNGDAQHCRENSPTCS